MNSTNPWNRRGLLICGGVWLALALALGTFVGSLNLPRLYRLVEHGVKTQGVVTAKEPQNHQYVHYTYRVGGSTFQGTGQSGWGNPPFQSLGPGDQVMVYYDTANPGWSLLGEPVPDFKNEVISVLMVVFIFPSLILWRLASKGPLPPIKGARIE